MTSTSAVLHAKLALPTLEKRRIIASLSMFYKINHGLVRLHQTNPKKSILHPVLIDIHSSREPQD